MEMLQLILQAHLIVSTSGSLCIWEYANQKSFSPTWALCSFWYSLTFTSSCAWSRFHFCDILVICYCKSEVLIYIPGPFWRHPFLGTVGCSQPSFQLPLGGNTTTPPFGQIAAQPEVTHELIQTVNGMLVKTLILNVRIIECFPNRNRHPIWLQRESSQLHMKLRIQKILN